MQSKLSKLSNSRIPVTRQDPANSNIMPKGTVVGASPKEQKIQTAKAELAKHVPGPGGIKMPISGGSRGVTPSPAPGLIGMPQPTPEGIAAGRAIDTKKKALNPPGSYTPPAGINMPGMRASAPLRTPQQMMKKGGQAKAYANGGSVKGSGCEQRGLRKCKVV